jgi:hypothetical protein
MSRQPLQIIRERLKVLEERDELLKLELRLSAEPKRASDRRSATRRHPRARHGAVLDTGITEAVIATFFDVPEIFTIHDSIKSMHSNGYQFQCANPEGAVSGALRKLAKKENSGIALVRAGRSGKPSTYKRR